MKLSTLPIYTEYYSDSLQRLWIGLVLHIDDYAAAPEDRINPSNIIDEYEDEEEIIYPDDQHGLWGMPDQ